MAALNFEKRGSFDVLMWAWSFSASTDLKHKFAGDEHWGCVFSFRNAYCVTFDWLSKSLSRVSWFLEPFNELLNYAQLTTLVLVWSSRLSIGGVTTTEEISCPICSGWRIWKWRESYQWVGWEIVIPAVSRSWASRNCIKNNHVYGIHDSGLLAHINSRLGVLGAVLWKGSFGVSCNCLSVKQTAERNVMQPENVPYSLVMGGIL